MKRFLCYCLVVGAPLLGMALLDGCSGDAGTAPTEGGAGTSPRPSTPRPPAGSRTMVSPLTVGLSTVAPAVTASGDVPRTNATVMGTPVSAPATETAHQNSPTPAVPPGVTAPPATTASTAPPRPPPPARPPSGPLAVVRSTDVSLGGDTSRFDYQSLDPQTGLLFIAHLGASRVTVFNTRTNQMVADIPAISSVHGVLALPALGRVYASATGDNQVAVIDEQTLKVMARIPGGSYPDGLAYDPNSKHGFVSDETGATATVIDATTNTRVATIPLGGEAGNTQYDTVSGYMFVDAQSLNQLVALDPATNKVVRRTPLPGCDHDHGLLIDAPARRAFVACDGNARLLTLDLDSMQVLDTQRVGDAPDVLALDPGWHRLYVAAESGVLSIFDEGGGVPRKLSEGRVAPAAHSVAVDPATHRVFLPLANVNGKPVLRIVQYSAPSGARGSDGSQLVRRQPDPTKVEMSPNRSRTEYAPLGRVGRRAPWGRICPGNQHEPSHTSKGFRS